MNDSLIMECGYKEGEFPEGGEHKKQKRAGILQGYTAKPHSYSQPIISLLSRPPFNKIPNLISSVDNNLVVSHTGVLDENILE
ncbi:hypothetical protein TNIN_424941 [Trichonephila inaurata madagascariensis]|uniref:Uncharacterized protein n=1 Tax=Trichonephila inaurata madagascariensis TaxID=2747483 RepID=A0A8X6X7G5_9ARAC|nr:hypothetical protein TNIN_424941 [Trichonephila inaurata madagascariensis]